MKEWFPHDYHASQDLGIIRILRIHGSRGYGVFWLATELLHANENVTRGSLIDFILHAFRDLSIDQSEQIVKDLIDCGLLKSGATDLQTGEIDETVIYSERVLRNKEAREAITEHKRAAAQKRWSKKPDAMQMHSNSIASAMLLDNRTEDNRTIVIKKVDAIFEFECTGGKMFHVEQKDYDQMKDLYPSVDIFAEMRKMKGWLIANKSKRKTHRGMPRFIHNWLAKAQDNGTHNRSDQSNANKIGERRNQYNSTEYDDQIRSIANAAIAGRSITDDPQAPALRQAGETH